MRSVLQGILIGIACILPGASGGVLAVAFGLYRPMLEAILSLRREPKRCLRFLVLPSAGIAAGILLGAVGLSDVMARHERLMLFFFCGLIAGGIPDLLKQAQQHETFPLSRMLSLAAGIIAALPMCLWHGSAGQSAALSPVQAFVTGMLEGVGTVVPGISASFVLIRLGWYRAYLTALSGLDAPRIALIGCGFAVSAFVCMHTIDRLFERCTGHAFYGVLGFMLVSLGLVFPGFTHGILFWAEAALLIAGFATVRLMGRFNNTEG